MIFGMSTAAFTTLHVIISLIAIAAGVVVFAGMIRQRSMQAMTWIFLVMTALTSITGFMFPNSHITPGIVLGVLSMIVLVLAALALYAKHLSSGWRKTYIITASMALYFNCFVLVVQSFEKIPALHALAPKGNELPFAIAQGILLVAFIWLTVATVKRFPASTSARATA